MISTSTLVFALCLATQHPAASKSFMAELKTDAHMIHTEAPQVLDVLIMDGVTMAPLKAFSVKATLSMPSMEDMVLDQPKATTSAQPGHVTIRATFPHPGEYKLTLHVTKDQTTAEIGMLIKVGAGMMGDKMVPMTMQADIGTWSANRQGSGTSWQPESSPMFMAMLPPIAGFEAGVMGTAQAGYVDDKGPRGAQQFFTDSMVMVMGHRDVGPGKVGVYLMTSLDPLLNGERGVPDLFQTGETAYGVPLVDRQHPHNLYSEIAASYSLPVAKDWTLFAYGGPAGEPALGDVMFMHRASGMEIPEAPITHHWFDSTHISFGVVTLGAVYADRWKLDGSWFNGHEPGENRYALGPEALNSGSGRLTFNPSKDWSFSASYGFLDSPEATNPGVGEHRSTLSAAYSHNLPSGDNLSITTYFGQDLEGSAPASNAFLFEATLYHGRDSLFTRYERVAKDDLYNVAPGDYTIDKLVFGDVHNFYSRSQLDIGLGAYAGVYSFPGALNPYYGRSPVTLGVFLRIRPSRM